MVKDKNKKKSDLITIAGMAVLAIILIESVVLTVFLVKNQTNSSTSITNAQEYTPAPSEDSR